MNIDKIKTQYEKALELKSSDKYAALLRVCRQILRNFITN